MQIFLRNSSLGSECTFLYKKLSVFVILLLVGIFGHDHDEQERVTSGARYSGVPQKVLVVLP